MSERNDKFLKEFRVWLENQGLSEKTISRHIDNASFYINEYLPREGERPMEYGPKLLDSFFRYFFIRKCMWSTPGTIKTTAASLKKFYRCMMERGYISRSDYEFVCSEIREGMDDWQWECEVYNRMDWDYYDDDDDDDDDGPIALEDLIRVSRLMPTDRMYDLAFAFRKEKPWNKIFEDELFAVRLSGGRIGYCNIMGRGGDHIALSVYPGEEAFSTFRALLGIDPSNAMSARSQDLLLQDCIQLSLEDRDYIDDEAAKAVRAYAKKAGIALRGSHAYPTFSRYKPHCIPWAITSEQEQEDITAALEAAFVLIRTVKGLDKGAVGLRSIYDDPKEIPLIDLSDEKKPVRLIPMPEPVERPCPEPTRINDIAVAKLKSRTQKGVLECEILRAPSPVVGENGEPPHFPAFLLSVGRKTGRIYGIGSAEGSEYDPDELMQSTIEALLNADVYPKEIRVRTAETKALLQGFCKKAGIKLTVAERLPKLDDAVRAMDEDLGGELDPEVGEEMLSAMLQELSTMSDSELRAMPREAAKALMTLVDAGMVPDTLAKRLTRLLRD